MKTYATPPAAIDASATAASVEFTALPRWCRQGSCGGVLVDALHGVEGGCELLLLAVVARALPEPRPADAGRAVAPDQLAARILADDVVEHEVLRDDHVAFHAHHLCDVRDAAGTVPPGRRRDKEVPPGADHF